jgi:hypothetical protein
MIVYSDDSYQGQKGGLLQTSQNSIYFTNDIFFVICWNQINIGEDWYPNFPEVVNAAQAASWGLRTCCQATACRHSESNSFQAAVNVPFFNGFICEGGRGKCCGWRIVISPGHMACNIVTWLPQGLRWATRSFRWGQYLTCWLAWAVPRRLSLSPGPPEPSDRKREGGGEIMNMLSDRFGLPIRSTEFPVLPMILHYGNIFGLVR